MSTETYRPTTRPNHRSYDSAPNLYTAQHQAMRHIARSGTSHEGCWCSYHRMQVHHTESYHQLKKEIKILIQRGNLLSYVKEKPHSEETNSEDPSTKKGKSVEEENETRLARHTLNTITRGFAWGGETISTRMRYARKVINVSHSTSPRSGEEKSVAVSFSKRDSRDILAHENDSMVIKVQIHDWSIKRVLIDMKNSI